MSWQYYAYGGPYNAYGVTSGTFIANGGVVGTFIGGSPFLYFNIIADNTSITFDYSTYKGATVWSPSPLSLPPTIYNGIAINVLSGPPIQSVNINPATNMIGFNTSRISFTSSQIQVDWQNLPFNTSTIVKLDINTNNFCPQGQGFWKNHPGLWPVTSLTLGSQTYTQDELLALFDTPPRGDASVILAHQLIAAKLNIANGSTPAPISTTITDADNLLSQFGGKLPYNVRTSAAIGQQMVNDANVLDRYNNGDLTSNCTP
jgi:hypothetical protein